MWDVKWVKLKNEQDSKRKKKKIQNREKSRESLKRRDLRTGPEKEYKTLTNAPNWKVFNFM